MVIVKGSGAASSDGVELRNDAEIAEEPTSFLIDALTEAYRTSLTRALGDRQTVQFNPGEDGL